MNQKFYVWLFSLISLLSVCTFSMTSFAEDEKQVQSNTSYHVELNFPENQNPDVSMYYDLKMDPGQTQTVSFVIINESDQEKTFNLSKNVATTSFMGAITYVPEGKEQLNESLRYPFYDISTVDSEVIVGPKEKKEVPVTLTMPKEGFNGTILGAIIISEKDIDGWVPEQGAMAKSKINYEIAFKLHESDEVVAPDLKLYDVVAGQIDNKNTIFAKLENVAPVIMNNVWVEAKITKKGSDKVLYRAKNNGMQVAPNSNFTFPISLGAQPFVAGTYTLYLFASSLGGYEWSLSSDFDISKNEVSKFNQLSVIPLEANEGLSWYVWVIIVILIIVVITAIIFVFKQSKAKKKNRVKKNIKRK